MNLVRTVTALLVLTLIATGPAISQSRSKAPNFSLKTADGRTVELAKQKGKLVIVNFWATWCGPCKAEIPGFLEVYEKYRSRGLEIVGISLDQGGWGKVKPFVDRFRMTYPVVIGDGALADAYGGIEAIPPTFIVDKKGNIVKRHVGYLSKSEFEKLVAAYL
jgi:cytochrome c biogenesis protein CcmG/thiol:disulfide interchange protein DsbE